jgi:hypothetical protein
MSLPMWPSAFIPVAVEMCSGSSTLLGRANFGEVSPRGRTLEGGALLDQLTFILCDGSQDADHHPASSGG